MEQGRIKLLQEIVLNKEYSLIISSFSFEERKYIVRVGIDNLHFIFFQDSLIFDFHIWWVTNHYIVFFIETQQKGVLIDEIQPYVFW